MAYLVDPLNDIFNEMTLIVGNFLYIKAFFPHRLQSVILSKCPISTYPMSIVIYANHPSG
jgi:hypothetical protein